MMPTTVTALAAASALVDDYFGRAIEALRAAVLTFGIELDREFDRGGVKPAKLDQLVEPYSEQLRALESARVFGSGFVAAKGAFGDTAGHLSWWQGDPVRKLLLAAQSVNKEHIDYTAHEWFRVPAETGRSHTVGPYVDYLCNDEYTVTVAVPVVLERGFVGVMALDVLVDSAERELWPRLAELGDKLVVANRSGRVLVSTDDRYETGDTVPEHELLGVRDDAGDDHAFVVLATSA